MGNQPPAGWAGGRLAWNAVLSRSPTHYVALTEVVAYPSGVEMTLVIRSKPEVVEPGPERIDEEVGSVGSRRIRRVTSSAAHVLDPTRSKSSEKERFGIGFSDGRKALPLELLPPAQRQSYILNPGDQPRLHRSGFRHIGGRDFYAWWWLQPLPPPGPLTFAFVWPEQGVEETLTVLDGNELVEAAQTAEKLWEV